VEELRIDRLGSKQGSRRFQRSDRCPFRHVLALNALIHVEQSAWATPQIEVNPMLLIFI
jgi:hypothetical protein